MLFFGVCFFLYFQRTSEFYTHSFLAKEGLIILIILHARHFVGTRERRLVTKLGLHVATQLVRYLRLSISRETFGVGKRVSV